MMELQSKNIRKTAWPQWPVYADEEIQAANKVLRSGNVNYWTGNECREFEKEYAHAVGTKYAVALMNGTVALEAALFACGIGPGDEVITTSRTFIASASAVVMRGAVPVIADVDINSQNITVETIKAVLTPRTRAIIAVHLAGWPCDMKAICHFAKMHNLFVIEDCAQAHGATIDGQQVGSFGDVAAFSFCQDKIISTGGEGGMITTDNVDMWEKIWSHKDHGKSFEAMYHRIHPPGFRWMHESFGTNWRMTEMQAAIGRVQLKKLPEWLLKRAQNANILYRYLDKMGIFRIPVPPKNIGHAYYKFYAFLNEEADLTRDSLLTAFNAAGIPVTAGSCSEIYRERAFINAKLAPSKRLPIAKKLGETSLMFVVHPTLSVEDMAAIGEIIVNLITDVSLSY